MAFKFIEGKRWIGGVYFADPSGCSRWYRVVGSLRLTYDQCWVLLVLVLFDPGSSARDSEEVRGPFGVVSGVLKRYKIQYRASIFTQR